MVYPFLDLLTEPKALVQSSVLSNSECFYLFRNIYKKSTIQNAKQNSLFSLEPLQAENMRPSENREKLSFLKKLVEERLISQIFHLEYAKSKLKLISCYFALTPKIHPFSIYKATLNSSIASIEAMLEEFPPLDKSKFEENLRADFQGKDIMLDINHNIMINPFTIIQKENFDFHPPQEMLDISIIEMKAELLQRNKVIDIPNYSLMSLRETEILDRFQLSENIFKKEIMPFYKKNIPTLSSKIKEIYLKNTISQLSSSDEETVHLTYFLANAVKNSFHLHARDTNTKKGPKYPGALTVNILLTLYERVQTEIKDHSQQKHIAKYNAIRHTLLAKKKNWQERIIFMKEEEYNKLHPITIHSLEADPSLAMEQWETPDGRMWVFVNLDMQSIFNLIEQMAQEVDTPNWQVLAIRNLIEIYENDLYQLFESTEFLRFYGIILNRVYIDHIHWLLRFLLDIKINWITDYLYKIARRSIQKEQELYYDKNQRRSERTEFEKNQKRQEFSKELNTIVQANEILNALDVYYFQKKSVPTIANIQNFIDPKQEHDISHFIKEQHFQVIPSIAGETDWQQNLLLYPKNYHWAIRCTKLKKLAEQVLDSHYVNQNKEIRSRFKRLLRLVKNDIISANKETIKRKIKEKVLEPSKKDFSKRQQAPNG